MDPFGSAPGEVESFTGGDDFIDGGQGFDMANGGAGYDTSIRCEVNVDVEVIL